VHSTPTNDGKLMQTATKSTLLELHNLAPEPAEEWARLLNFVGLNHQDKRAMAGTVEVLMRRASELVVDTYNYLLSVPETAAILGWESGADEAHLEERRRFFTIWLARVIGMDTSDEFAYYLFRAGKFHAGHGPRQIHTPTAYVTTSIGLVGATFARYMQEANLSGDVVAPALAGWNKYLSVQLQIMHLGYQIAQEYEKGDFTIPISLFGRMRAVVGKREVIVHANEGRTVADVLRQFFNYHPTARTFALERVWHSHEKRNSDWVEVNPSYIPRPRGWRILLNGRDVTYAGGLCMPVQKRDSISIFPPGR
jgi:molybdopterin converting factor small subunit